MELAVNQFTKGLQMDTNPMVQGNDTLTDCLNGTLITMNGNEVILLNDMGNRRVDNAFLPSGYEPVGIKEYGGIIYIAAYNPITNKSQIGSFPSPLRKFDLETTGFTNDDIFNYEPYYFQNNYLTKEEVLFPLGVDLHPGDKFSVYLNNNNDDLSNLVTDYYGNGKNKNFTLSLGVLNSLNQFVDITKTLKRFKLDEHNNVVITEDKEDGYFIAIQNPISLDPQTYLDQVLALHRLKMAVNTYSYKLSGPLYLKSHFNHIEEFQYNIRGWLEKEGQSETYTLNLQIEGVVSYEYLDERILFDCFDFFIENVKQNRNESYDNYHLEDLGVKNNLKVKKLVNTYTVQGVRSDDIINYKIEVKATGDLLQDNTVLLEHPTYYVKNLTLIGTILVDLLGSNQVGIKGWKTFVDDDSVTLRLSLDSYPAINKSFKDLSFKFYEYNKNREEFYRTPVAVYPDPTIHLPVYNGSQSIIFDLGELGLEKRKLYEVRVFYNVYDENGTIEEPNTQIGGDKWILTTKLFNSLYNNNKITDLCNSDSPEYLEKLKIKAVVTDNPKISNKYSYVEDGRFIYPGSGSESATDFYVVNHLNKVKAKHNYTVSIENEELYPDFITINNNATITNATPKESHSFNDLTINSYGNIGLEIDLNSELFSINISDLDEAIQIQYKDIFRAKKTTDVSLTAYNVFAPISSVLDNMFDDDRGVYIVKNEHTGSKDDHWVKIRGKIDIDRWWDNELNGTPNLYRVEKEGDPQFSFLDYSERIFNVWNNENNSKVPFIYMNIGKKVENSTIVVDGDSNAKYKFHNRRENGGLSPFSPNYYCRVWWKNTKNGGEWTLLNKLFSDKEEPNHYNIYNNYSNGGTTVIDYGSNIDIDKKDFPTTDHEGLNNFLLLPSLPTAGSRLVDFDDEEGGNSNTGTIPRRPFEDNIIGNRIERHEGDIDNPPQLLDLVLDIEGESVAIVHNTYQSLTSQELSKFSKFLLSNVFKHDYVYRVYDEYQGIATQLEIADKNCYSYNSKYNALITIKYSPSVGSNTNLLDCSKVPDGFGPQFIEDKEKRVLEPYYYSTTIESSDKFKDKVLNYLSDDTYSELNGIDLETGLTVDEIGNKLGANMIYYRNEKGSLKSVIKLPLQIDNINTIASGNNNINVLLHTGGKDALDRRYDLIWEGASKHGRTSLDFYGVDVVNLI